MKNLPLLFFVVLFYSHASAMDKQLHSQTQAAVTNTANQIHVNNGILHANNTWLYTNDLILSDKLPGENTSWSYHFTPDGTPPNANTTWTPLSAGAQISAKEIPGIANTPGYYYITNHLPATNPVKIIQYQITGLLPSKDIALSNDLDDPVTFETIIQPAGFHPNLNLHFSGTGVGHLVYLDIEDSVGFDAGEPITLFSEAAFAWDTPGRKMLTITGPGNRTYTTAFDIVQLVPEEKETVILVNANDTDNTGKRDYKKDNLEDDQPDPELRRTNFLLSCPHDDPTQPPYWQHGLHEDIPSINAFLQNLKNRNVAIYLTRTNGNFQLHGSDIKDGEETELLVNDFITDPDPDADPDDTGDFNPDKTGDPGNSYYLYQLNSTTDIEDILEFFDNLYLEGVLASNTQNDSFLSCSFQKIKNNKWHTLANAWLPVTTIRLRMDYSPDAIDIASGINSSEWFPFPNDPLNIIYNPAVILLPDPNDPDQHNTTARFELEEFGKKFLTLPKYNNLIEWRIYSLPDIEIPFNDENFPQDTMGEITGGNADFVGPHHGRQIEITGTAKGFIRIGVRLKDTNTDYLQINVLVAPEIKVPYAFQFFTGTSPENENPKIRQAIDKTPDIIKVSNILLRQVGMKLIPAEPAQLIPQHHIAQHKTPLDNIVTTYKPDGITSYGQFNTVPFELPTHRDAQQVKIINDQGQTLTISGNPLNNILYQLETKNPGQHVFPLPFFVPPWVFDPQNPPSVVFDSPASLQNVTIPDKHTLIHYNTPDWINKNAEYLTHSLSSLPQIYNINVVEKNDPEVKGVTAAKPKHNIAIPSIRELEIICEDEYRDMTILKAPTTLIQKTILNPPAPPTFQQIPYDFHGSLIYLRPSFFPDRPLTKFFAGASVIVHEFGHSCGLRHRSNGIPHDTDSDADNFFSTGGLPKVDVNKSEYSQPNLIANGRNHKNLMTPAPNYSLDLDLPQAIIMRNSIFPPPANP